MLGIAIWGFILITASEGAAVGPFPSQEICQEAREKFAARPEVVALSKCVQVVVQPLPKA